MRFARAVFLVAGCYGLLVTLPLYFLEGRVGRDSPPEITHPEFFYGFAGLCLAWQLMFLVIGGDPARYRLAMLPSIVEKFSYVVAIAVLSANGRVAAPMLAPAVIDAVLGALFIAAFVRTGNRR